MKNRTKRYMAFIKKIKATGYFMASQMICPLGIMKKYEFHKAESWVEKLPKKYSDIAYNIIDRIHLEYHTENEQGFSAFKMDNAMMYGTCN